MIDMDTYLRKFTKSDVSQVLAIEQAVHVTPWTKEVFDTCFEQDYQGWVLVLDKHILGFIIVSTYTDECHILNLGVSSQYQRQGLGRKLLEHVLEEAKSKGAMVAYLEVRRSNTRAIALYKKTHFQQIGERKDYYPTVNGREDALVFAAVLKRHA